MIMPKVLRKLFSILEYNGIATFLTVAAIFAILPLIIFPIFGHDFLFTLYNYKGSIKFDSFSQIENSFYLGYFLMISIILLVFTIIVYPNMINNWQTKHFFFFSTLISFLFLGVLLIHGPWNSEFYTYEVTSAIVRIKHYFKGQILYWYDGRGFGTPFPTIQAPDTHPLFMISPFFSLRTVYSLFWIIHLIMGTFYYIRLCRLINLDKSLSIFSGILFVFSMGTIMTTVFYNFSSRFVCWSMYPIITYYCFKLFLSDSHKRKNLVVTLALLISFTVFNGLPSDYASYFIILGLSFVIILLFRPNLNLIKSFSLVLIISSLMASPRVFYILNELSLFPQESIGTHAQGGFSIMQTLRFNFTPLDLSSLDRRFFLISYLFPFDKGYEVGNAIMESIYKLIINKPRVPFIGLIYGTLALSSIIILVKFFTKKKY